MTIEVENEPTNAEQQEDIEKKQENAKINLSFLDLSRYVDDFKFNDNEKEELQKMSQFMVWFWKIKAFNIALYEDSFMLLMILEENYENVMGTMRLEKDLNREIQQWLFDFYFSYAYYIEYLENQNYRLDYQIKKYVQDLISLV
ncbi:hypothetical protein IMG5_149880 [Ichthyophthirius multifiliis]|uniref:Uncharacterized protein n=1 Tax=Ichthyophthirius multifiliis TaxID=5932 RepID=G0QYI1_ICHMU|nr:hypothetical protein IMG5_149880 [Ichthyophthirius multifiliis]EGR29720.1 hypothetical protein IMG5_149880 [Ichthyophthirius multifiliis]|eukprot:XP_004030956.1 hypothetical protein IMG5_149880 [Ichthyophthirius multifiliis]